MNTYSHVARRLPRGSRAWLECCGRPWPWTTAIVSEMSSRCRCCSRCCSSSLPPGNYGGASRWPAGLRVGRQGLEPLKTRIKRRSWTVPSPCERIRTFGRSMRSRSTLWSCVRVGSSALLLALLLARGICTSARGCYACVSLSALATSRRAKATAASP
jgi:hypothetical protein